MSDLRSSRTRQALAWCLARAGVPLIAARVMRPGLGGPVNVVSCPSPSVEALISTTGSQWKTR